jgi:deoxyribonuclease V
MPNAKALHRWDVSPKEAVALQRALQGRVITHDDLGLLSRIAGIDVGFEERGRVTRAAVAVLSFPGLELVDHATARQPTCFPYVPGLLSFREVPAVLAAWEALDEQPDLLICDGQGYAHPRRFGLACHLGVWTGLPSIGVGKTRLIGEHGPVPEGRGEWCSLVDKDEVIGAVLRTRAGVKPVYVSIGHRVTLETAVAIVMRCCTRYRLPETTRWAHRLASG